MKMAEVIVQHLVDLGMRHPAESTIGLITCLVASTEDVEEQTGSRLHALLGTVKSVIRTKTTRAKQLKRDPDPYYVRLPQDPQGLDRVLRQTFFADGFTAPVRQLLATREDAARTMPLRKTHRSIAQAKALPPYPWPAMGGMGMYPSMPLPYYGMPGCVPSQGHVVDPQINLQLLRPQGGSLALPALPAPALPAPQAQPPTVVTGLASTPAPLRQLLERANTAETATMPAAPLALEDRTPVGTGMAASALPEPQQSVVVAAGSQTADSMESVAAPHDKLEGTLAFCEAPKSGALPGKLAQSVAKLAQQEYGRTLDLPQGQTSEPEHGPQKKPAGRAAPKPKPMASKPKALAKGKAATKPKGSAKAKAAAAAMKKPAAASSGKRPASSLSVDAAKQITRAQSFARKPQGCSKCRQRRGCTRSCWLGRGLELID